MKWNLLLLSTLAGISASPFERRGLINQGQGDASYYTEGTFALGACGYIASELHVALNAADFDAFTPNGNPNKNSLCGQCIRVTCTEGSKCDVGKSIVVPITDRCPGCTGGRKLDLSEAAMRALGSNAITSGVIPVSYEPVDCRGGTVEKKDPSPARVVQGESTCGNGNRGNGQCADASLCCSKWGWCGKGDDYCIL